MSLSSAALAIGCVLTLFGWWLTRAVAGAGLRATAPLALFAIFLDGALPLAVFGFLYAATGRAVFAGALTLALAAGFAFADRRKREVLIEPIVISDVFLAFDIFRHPSLALPFPDMARVMTGVGLVASAFGALLVLEPAAWPWSPWPALSIAVAVLAAIWALTRPLNAAAGRILRRLAPSGDPVRDGARFGALATLAIYGIVARAERTRRRAATAPCAVAVPLLRHHAGCAPVVLVQCESFFDVRRIHPSVDRALLPNLDRCRRGGLQWGHLSVPCWGANTVRTEFAVLTGLPEAAIGLDKFNPYQGFARAPVSSIAWQMRSEGYHTICIHPFDRRFYGRDRVMRNLGFDEFMGEEVFNGAERIGAYVADVEVARFTAQLLKEREPNVFVFVVTMENHGPWPNGHANGALNGADLWHQGLALPEDERHALKGFMQGVRNADAMLGVLTHAFAAGPPGGLLAMYGDHLPSFPKTFRSLGFCDGRSDYLLWRAGSGEGVRRDLAAQDLARTILEARRAPATAIAAYGGS